MSISGEPPSGELPPIPRPEAPISKSPEIKPPEVKPLGQIEQEMVTRIDKDGDPDLVLQDLAKPEIPQAAGMDFDPRYKAIQEELKQKWLQEHPEQDFLSEAGQNYNLGYVDPKERNKPTLKSDTDRLFIERYPEDAKAYDEKERTRVYDNPNDDPLIKQFEADILRATNLDSQVQNANRASGIDSYGNVWSRVNARETIRRWDQFIDQYPEKAKEYAEKGHTGLKRAFEERERQRQQTTSTEKAQVVTAKYEAKQVSSTEEVGKRIREQVGFTKDLTLEDLERRRQELKSHPQLSSKTLTDTLVGVEEQATFCWVQTDKIVGRTWEQPESWASEIEARKGRVTQVAKEIIDSDGNPQTMENVFHSEKGSERIKLTAIMGPAGPMYYVDDGTHRIAASMTAGIKEIPCDVKSINPGSLDNLIIPRQALLDPIANNYYMAGRWEEWAQR